MNSPTKQNTSDNICRRPNQRWNNAVSLCHSYTIQKRSDTCPACSNGQAIIKCWIVFKSFSVNQNKFLHS